MSNETIQVSLSHSLDPHLLALANFPIGYRTREKDGAMIINTTYLQQATKTELLDAIDQLIMEYAVADMLDIGSKDNNDTQ